MDMHTSKPLDLLTQIESAIEHAMTEIGVIEDLDPVEVKDQEQKRKTEYKKRKREEYVKEEAAANMEKNAELKARMERVVQKVGKPTMQRSIKKRVTKEIKEVKVDEDRLDIIRYLGEDMVMLSDEMKKNNNTMSNT